MVWASPSLSNEKSNCGPWLAVSVWSMGNFMMSPCHIIIMMLGNSKLAPAVSISITCRASKAFLPTPMRGIRAFLDLFMRFASLFPSPSPSAAPTLSLSLSALGIFFLFYVWCFVRLALERCSSNVNINGMPLKCVCSHIYLGAAA